MSPGWFNESGRGSGDIARGEKPTRRRCQHIATTSSISIFFNICFGVGVGVAIRDMLDRERCVWGRFFSIRSCRIEEEET